MDKISEDAIKIVSSLSLENRRVWNAAIKACVKKLEKEFVEPEVVIKIIKELIV